MLSTQSHSYSQIFLLSALSTFAFFPLTQAASGENIPAGTSTSFSLSAKDLLKEESKKLYQPVPDIHFNLPTKGTYTLSQLWAEKPVLITLFYNKCKGTCSPFLRSLKKAVEKVGGLGTDYRVLSLSFDESDSLEDVDELAKELGIQIENQWLVGTSTPQEIADLSESIGFWHQPIPKTDQFDHPSLIAGVRNGRIIRVLLGNNVSASRLKEMVFELKGIAVPFYSQPGQETRFRCLQIDENTGEVRWSWGMALLFIPGILALIIALLIFRKRKK